jgi:hypothetical protein
MKKILCALVFCMLALPALAQQNQSAEQRAAAGCTVPSNSIACRQFALKIAQDRFKAVVPNMSVTLAGDQMDALVFTDSVDYKNPEFVANFKKSVRTSEMEEASCEVGFKQIRFSGVMPTSGARENQNWNLDCPTGAETSAVSAQMPQSSSQPASQQVLNGFETNELSCPAVAYCRDAFALLMETKSKSTWPHLSLVAVGQNKDVLAFEDRLDLKQPDVLSNFLQRITTAYWKETYCKLGFRAIHVTTGEKSSDKDFRLDCTTILQSQTSTSATQPPSQPPQPSPQAPIDQCSLAGTNSGECRQQIASVARVWGTSGTQVEAVGDAVVFIDPKYDNAIARQHFHDAMGANADNSLCTFGFKRMRLASSAALKGIGEEEYALNCTRASTSLVSQAPGFSGYSTEPLDLSLSTLPPGYRGNDPETVFTALSSSTKKGEFESTAEYNQRLMGLTVIAGSLTDSSVYAFYVESGGYAQQSEARYDADKQLLTLSIQLASVSKKRTVKQECSERIVRLGLCTDSTESYIAGYNFLSKTKWLNNGTHLGANSYGAVAEVTTEYRWQDTIEFPNIDEFSSKQSIYGQDLSIDLPVGPTEAKTLKGNLRILAICKLIAPYVASDAGSSDATLSEPVDLITFFQTLETQLLELWVYDISTGKVIAKVQAGQKLASGDAVAPTEGTPRTAVQTSATNLVENTLPRMTTEEAKRSVSSKSQIYVNCTVGDKEIRSTSFYIGDSVVATVPCGTALTAVALDAKAGCFKVKMDNNIVGYIPVGYVSNTKPEMPTKSKY